MNLKYYLRGLGLGIVMTAVIMGIVTHSQKETFTDEEIMEKAKELGMIEDSELAKYLEEAKAETEERVRKEAAEEYAAAKSTASITEEGDTELNGREPAEEEIEREEDLEDGMESGQEREDGSARVQGVEEEEEQEAPVVFTVKRGEAPYSIGQRLEEEGLLPEDADFDKFMVDNGYDRKIVAAEYEIPAGADMKTIAEIITKQR